MKWKNKYICNIFFPSIPDVLAKHGVNCDHRSSLDLLCLSLHSLTSSLVILFTFLIDLFTWLIILFTCYLLHFTCWPFHLTRYPLRNLVFFYFIIWFSVVCLLATRTLPVFRIITSTKPSLEHCQIWLLKFTRSLSLPFTPHQHAILSSGTVNLTCEVTQERAPDPYSWKHLIKHNHSKWHLTDIRLSHHGCVCLLVPPCSVA